MKDTLMDRLDQIRRKLDTLSSYDLEQCADLDLGIKKHKFRLEPPLPEAEVVAFEERYGISLPPEYRAFITSVGSSGAGPYYGLLPLAQATEHLDCDDEGMCKRKLGAVFPLSDKVYQPDWKLGQDDWLVEVGGINWKERRYGPESWDPFQGTIAICDQGCTYYAVLVLNGPQRGAVWNIELHLSPPMKAPYAGFLDYSEDWVDRMLAKEKQFWYGYPRIQKSNHVGDAMAEDWKFFTRDKESDYYINPKSKIHVGKGVFEIQVKAVCIDKEKFLSGIKAFGKHVENYEKYSHTIFEANIDCPNKRCLVKLITEYDNKGKVIDYVAGALTNWVPVSKGTLYEILYQAACHQHPDGCMRTHRVLARQKC